MFDTSIIVLTINSRRAHGVPPHDGEPHPKGGGCGGEVAECGLLRWNDILVTWIPKNKNSTVFVIGKAIVTKYIFENYSTEKRETHRHSLCLLSGFRLVFLSLQELGVRPFVFVFWRRAATKHQLNSLCAALFTSLVEFCNSETKTEAPGPGWSRSSGLQEQRSAKRHLHPIKFRVSLPTDSFTVGEAAYYDETRLLLSETKSNGDVVFYRSKGVCERRFSSRPRCLRQEGLFCRSQREKQVSTRFWRPFELYVHRIPDWLWFGLRHDYVKYYVERNLELSDLTVNQWMSFVEKVSRLIIKPPVETETRHPIYYRCSKSSSSNGSDWTRPMLIYSCSISIRF